MTPGRRIALLGLVWLGLFAGGIAHMALIEPTGEGFVRGLDRVTGFLAWQAAALVAALAALWCARADRTRLGRLERRLGHLPAAISGLLFLGLAVLIAYGVLSA